MVTNQTVLSERGQQILAEIVDIYSTSGVPVGSKALVEQSKLQLSPATVRNVMQDLEKRGFLTHPHTSAGRVPTSEGYRYYANNLVLTHNLPQEFQQEIDRNLAGAKNLHGLLKAASETLSHITGCASLITAPKLANDPLEQVEFIRLSGDRVLVVMVTTHGTIENRIIEVPAFIDTAELNKASAQLKKVIAGQTLDEARDQMIAAIAEQRGRVNEMIDQMMAAAHEWGQPVVSDGAMVIAGSNNLFQYPELVREKLQNLVKIFEEKRLLMALMDEVRHGKGVQIFIGKDCPIAGVQSITEDCAIVASPYQGANGNLVGTLGVIGPMRLNYKHAVGVVDYTRHVIGHVLNQHATNQKRDAS